MAKIRLTQAANKERSLKVYEQLINEYPEAECSLDHKSPFELLIATILSAQCTDKRVNIVTTKLFKALKTPGDYLSIRQKELEEYIRTCGFYRQKSKSIINTCRTLVEHFDSKVPQSMEELTQLDGVGRKTANVVRGQCFGLPAVVVDTHCTRLSQRLGFTKNKDPHKIELDLMKIWPERIWTLFSHCFVFHGRAVCNARSPQCTSCVLSNLCPFPSTREGQKIYR